MISLMANSNAKEEDKEEDGLILVAQNSFLLIDTNRFSIYNLWRSFESNLHEAILVTAEFYANIVQVVVGDFILVGSWITIYDVEYRFVPIANLIRTSVFAEV